MIDSPIHIIMTTLRQITEYRIGGRPYLAKVSYDRPGGSDVWVTNNIRNEVKNNEH